MEKQVYVVNEELCSGCRNCEMWCSFLQTERKEFNSVYSRVSIIKDIDGELNIPNVICDSQACSDCSSHSSNNQPVCVEVCPTGCLIYTDAEDINIKKAEFEEARKLQPVFKLITPWKYPYPWRPLERDEF